MFPCHFGLPVPGSPAYYLPAHFTHCNSYRLPTTLTDVLRSVLHCHPTAIYHYAFYPLFWFPDSYAFTTGLFLPGLRFGFSADARVHHAFCHIPHLDTNRSVPTFGQDVSFIATGSTIWVPASFSFLHGLSQFLQFTAHFFCYHRHTFVLLVRSRSSFLPPATDFGSHCLHTCTHLPFCVLTGTSSVIWFVRYRSRFRFLHRTRVLPTTVLLLLRVPPLHALRHHRTATFWFTIPPFYTHRTTQVLQPPTTFHVLRSVGSILPLLPLFPCTATTPPHCHPPTVLEHLRSALPAVHIVLFLPFVKPATCLLLLR